MKKNPNLLYWPSALCVGCKSKPCIHVWFSSSGIGSIGRRNISPSTWVSNFRYSRARHRTPIVPLLMFLVWCLVRCTLPIGDASVLYGNRYNSLIQGGERSNIVWARRHQSLQNGSFPRKTDIYTNNFNQALSGVRKRELNCVISTCPRPWSCSMNRFVGGTRFLGGSVTQQNWPSRPSRHRSAT